MKILEAIKIIGMVQGLVEIIQYLKGNIITEKYYQVVIEPIFTECKEYIDSLKLDLEENYRYKPMFDSNKRLLEVTLENLKKETEKLLEKDKE